MPSDVFKFTESKIKNLSPPLNERIIYKDTDSRGLCLRVMPSGTKTFFLRRKINGKSERITIGRHPETSVPIARKIAAKMHLQLDAGKNPNDERRTAKSELALSQFFELYMERHVTNHNKRPEDTRAEYRRYIEKPLGNKKLSEITKSKIADLHSKLGKEIGGRTANKVHTILRAIFNRALNWEYFDKENPTRGIKRFKEEKRERFLSKAEIRRFFDALELEENETMKDFFLTLLFTGARSGEVRAMEWRAIDFDERVWRLEGRLTKTSEPRTVILPSPLIEILTARKISSDKSFVFSSKSKSGFLQEPKTAWKRILLRADIQNFRIHDLRHTWASWMVSEGVSLPVIQRALGHKNISSTAIYANSNIEMLRAESEKTAKKLVDITTRPKKAI